MLISDWSSYLCSSDLDGQTARAAGRMAHRTHRVDRVRLQAYFLVYGNVQHGLQLIDAADQQRRVWAVQMLPVGQCSCYQMRAGRVTRGGHVYGLAAICAGIVPNPGEGALDLFDDVAHLDFRTEVVIDHDS